MWFIVALIAFFLMAGVSVADKFLLTKSKLVPISFAFMVSLLGALASSVLVFFEPNFYLPARQLGQIIIAGSGFYFGVYFMYLVVVRHEVSRVNPMINSTVPIIAYLLTFLLVVERMAGLKLLGAAIVIIGSYLLSQAGVKKTRLDARALWLVFFSALMFGVHFVFSKAVYEQMSFLNAFVWIRWSILFAALVYTTFSLSWLKVFGKSKSVEKVSAKTQWFVLVFGQAMGAVAVILQQYAINLGNVTLVTALQGVQYLFVLILAIVLTKKFPALFKEDVAPAVVAKKAVYSLLLIAGVALILL